MQAPEGYYINDSEVYRFSFQYTNDKEASVSFTHTFQNERVDAAIHLVKEDAETGGTPQGDAVFEGAVYGLYAREDIVHPDGKPECYTRLANRWQRSRQIKWQSFCRGFVPWEILHKRTHSARRLSAG